MNQAVTPEIIQRVRDRDADAFTVIVDNFNVSIYNLCYRMLYDAGDAEDAAQEVFLKVWRNIEKYDDSRTFSTWILSIATYHCIDLIRKKKVPTIEIDETMEEVIPDKIPTPKHVLMERETQAEVQAMLSELSEIDRAILILRYWHDQSDREIGASVGLSEGAVRSRIFRARKQLVALARKKKDAAGMEVANA